MKNYVMKGEKLTVNAPVDVESGDLVLVNHLYGVAIVSAKEGEEVTIATEGVFEFNKDNQAVSVGEKAYYREDTGQITKTENHAVLGDHDEDDATPDTSMEVSHKLVGVFVQEATANDKKVQVKID